MISIKGLHKYFNKGRNNEIHVINDVNLELPERGMTAIFGRSGCGKTTLLNVIGGLDSFASGSITIEGNDVKKNTDDIRNEYVGYIFQNYNLNKNETCFDNVADALLLCGMTDKEEIERRVIAALRNVGMEKYKKRTPDTLSGGQQQRIAIARAIVKNPKIILADEPTGNLDEANTVMIMDLLKAISRDHLVLLVTHEANLVDYYCDTVIELSDGRVESIKENESASGFFARDKNDIYLGELERQETVTENAVIEYYGDKPERPIKIKIVNSGGRLYLDLGSERVQIVDGTSEIRLREGVYKEKEKKNAVSENIDMTELPPVKATRHGRLFTFKSSLISALRVNFAKRKKGKALLVSCMCLFSSVLVFMSAAFGTAFRDIGTASDAYNHNVFYLYTQGGEVSDKLLSAMAENKAGIDFIRLSSEHNKGDKEIIFRTGSFDSFEQYLADPFSTNAAILDTTLIEGMTAQEGRVDTLSDAEIVITTKVADALLEKSTLGYITERRDLIGLVAQNLTIDGKSARIVGIVESEESAVYLNELSMAKYVMNYMGGFGFTKLASDYGIALGEGETILAIRNERADVEYPKVGETIKIQGRELNVKEIKTFTYEYATYLYNKDVAKIEEWDYFCKLTEEEYPELIPDTPEFNKRLDELMMAGHFEYLDYYYSELDSFFRDYAFFENNFEVWLYREKAVENVKYLFAPDEYYRSVKFKELYGRYPTVTELEEFEIKGIRELWQEYNDLYGEEFYSKNQYSQSIGISAYLISDADYIALSKALGETHPSATESIGVNVGKKTGMQTADIVVDMEYITSSVYTVIHSNNPEATEAFLKSEFSDLEVPSKYQEAIITPNMLFDSIIEENLENIISQIITMGVLLILMSACMYFIMRSSLMNRIKEVGIYRAIGVSSKNLIFKFAIEAAVLATLTVFIGYIISSAFLYAMFGMSTLIADAMYYPAWLALLVLVILYTISIFFGVLPIISLTRRTPSAILSKYDI